MPTFTMKCPWCGAAVNKSMIIHSNGKGSGNSGQCNKCKNPIKWWAENNRPKIVKN